MGAKPAGDFSASASHTNMLQQVFGRSVFLSSLFIVDFHPFFFPKGGKEWNEGGFEPPKPHVYDMLNNCTYYIYI